MEYKSEYWERIESIFEKQRQKGINKYGMKLEQNEEQITKRLRYIEEELIDALMYIEWLKEGLKVAAKKGSIRIK